MNLAKFNIINDKDIDILVILEPTGEEYIIRPKEKCTMSCTMSDIEPIEFYYCDGYIVVYSLENSVIDIKTA